MAGLVQLEVDHGHLSIIKKVYLMKKKEQEAKLLAKINQLLQQDITDKEREIFERAKKKTGKKRLFSCSCRKSEKCLDPIGCEKQSF